jgi:hypothetical protein
MFMIAQMDYFYNNNKRIQTQPALTQNEIDKVSEFIGNKASIVSTGVIKDIEVVADTKNVSSLIDEKTLQSIIEKEIEKAELDSLLKEVDMLVGKDSNKQNIESNYTDENFPGAVPGGAQQGTAGFQVNESILRIISDSRNTNISNREVHNPIRPKVEPTNITNNNIKILKPPNRGNDHDGPVGL